MPTDRELAEFIPDERMTFRLPARHKRYLESYARAHFKTVGDVLREILREWLGDVGEQKRGKRTDVH